MALYRVVFGVLALAAIAVHLADLQARGTLDRVSYFTIDANLIGATVLLLFAARWRGTVSPTMELVRGAAVVYLSVTGVVFSPGHHPAGRRGTTRRVTGAPPGETPGTSLLHSRPHGADREEYRSTGRPESAGHGCEPAQARRANVAREP